MKRTIIPASQIAQSIHLLRGQKVMLDSDLAVLYGVPTGHLNRAVKRNAGRFPTDFMFQLGADEVHSLRCQIGISKLGRGGDRYRPYAFTEQGVAVLSSVLRSGSAGERTRLACWRWRPRHRELFLTSGTLFRDIHLTAFRRGRRKQHARRVRSPIQSA